MDFKVGCVCVLVNLVLNMFDVFCCVVYYIFWVGFVWVWYILVVEEVVLIFVDVECIKYVVINSF